MGRKLSVTLSHSGKQHSYHVAHGLKEIGMLDRFYTSSYITLIYTRGISMSFKCIKGMFTRLTVVSQLKTFKLNQEYDSLMLPTVFEGSRLVIVTKIPFGFPVIATLHSVGHELINNSENGYIVPIRNEYALLEAILSLKFKFQEEYQVMRLNAKKTVEAYTWNAYQSGLAMVCQQIKTKLQ